MPTKIAPRRHHHSQGLANHAADVCDLSMEWSHKFGEGARRASNNRVTITRVPTSTTRGAGVETNVSGEREMLYPHLRTAGTRRDATAGAPAPAPAPAASRRASGYGPLSQR